MRAVVIAAFAVAACATLAAGAIAAPRSLATSAPSSSGFTTVWRHSTLCDAAGGAALSPDGQVLFGCNDGGLYSLSAANGARNWKFQSTGGFDMTPLIANGTVFIGDVGGNFYAVDLQTGDRLWMATHRNGFLSGVAAYSAADNVVAATSSSFTLLFDAHNGTTLFELNGFSSPTVANGLLFVGGEDGYLYGYNMTTGNSIYSWSGSGANFNQPAILGSTAAFTTTIEFNVVDFSAQNPVAWRVDAASTYSNAVIPSVDVAAFGTDDGRIIVAEVFTRRLKWQYNTSNRATISTTPAVAGDNVFAGTVYGEVYAVSLTTGAAVAQTNLTGFVGSAIAVDVARNIIYVAGNGVVAALTTGSAPTAPPLTTPPPTNPPSPAATITQTRCINGNCTDCQQKTVAVGCETTSPQSSVLRTCVDAGRVMRAVVFTASATCNATASPSDTFNFPVNTCVRDIAGSFIVDQCA